MQLFLGFVLLFAVLQGAASLLNSTRGEWGIFVGLSVLLAAWAVQKVLYRENLRDIGIRGSGLRGLVAAVVISAALCATAAIYVRAIGAPASIYPNAFWLALGIVAQGGVAEELVFRGYLFGHLRRTRPFWRAATASVAPFAVVHLLTFFTMDWPIALAALLLSIAVSFPYAYLFELSAGTIWGPSLVHAVTQAVPKLFIVEDANFPLVWMALVLTFSCGVFLIPRRQGVPSPRTIFARL